jgi:hypothetical protein
MWRRATQPTASWQTSVRGADLRIIVFTAAPGSEAADKLQLLIVLGAEDMTAPGLPGASPI